MRVNLTITTNKFEAMERDADETTSRRCALFGLLHTLVDRAFSLIEPPPPHGALSLIRGGLWH